MPIGFKERKEVKRITKHPSVLSIHETESVMSSGEQGGDDEEIFAMSYGDGSGPSGVTPSSPAVTVPSVPPSPAAPPKSQPHVPLNQRCRLCLSTEHTRCDVVTDPAVLDRLLAIRNQNFSEHRAYQEAQGIKPKPPVTPATRSQPPGQRPPQTVNSIETEGVMPIPGVDEPIPVDLSHRAQGN